MLPNYGWMDETLVNRIDRDDHISPINMVNEHAVTHDPLVVLVSTKPVMLVSSTNNNKPYG